MCYLSCNVAQQLAQARTIEQVCSLEIVGESARTLRNTQPKLSDRSRSCGYFAVGTKGVETCS